MTVSRTKKPNWAIALGIPLLIFLACFIITLTAKFKTNSILLSNAILIDTLLVAPLIYFLAIRKTKISALTVTRIFVAGLIVCGLILNAQSNVFLQTVKTWISPVFEATVLFFIGRKFHVAGKKAKAANAGKPDFLMHCRAVMFQVFGNEKLSAIIASEIAVMYYVFFSSKDKTIDYEKKFTVYKENGISMVLWIILFIFLIETTGVHFLLRLWFTTTAWIITALSVYTCFQLFAHIKAVKARPIIISKETLEIHNGLAGDAYIALDNIEKFELSKKVPMGRNPVKIALLKGMENHNVVVYLKKPIQVTKIFGLKKTTDTVLFYVDQSTKFSTALALQMLNKRN